MLYSQREEEFELNAKGVPLEIFCSSKWMMLPLLSTRLFPRFVGLREYLMEYLMISFFPSIAHPAMACC